MKILFDTNVVLDVLLDRSPFSDTSTKLFEYVETGEIFGYICATTVTTIHYLASKTIGKSGALIEISKLLALFEIAPVNRGIVELAMNSKISDFEDAILCEAALHVSADGIVTRNAKDFKQAKLSIYSPEELHDILELQSNQ